MPYSHIGGDRHRHLDPVGSNHVTHEHPEGAQDHPDHEGLWPPEGGAPQGEPTDVVTAFMVWQTPDGVWAASPDITQPLRLQRQAHTYDFTAACACVSRDVASIEFINRNMAHAQGLAAQLQAAREAQHLGIGVPNGGRPGAGPVRRMGPERSV